MENNPFHLHLKFVSNLDDQQNLPHKNHMFLFPSSWLRKIMLCAVNIRFFDIGKNFKTNPNIFLQDCANDIQQPVLFLFVQDNALRINQSEIEILIQIIIKKLSTFRFRFFSERQK